MLTTVGKFCPKYNIPATPLSVPELSAVIDLLSPEGQDFLRYVENNTGLTISYSSNLISLEDTLWVQHDNGLVLPEWTISVLDQYIVPLVDIQYGMMGQGGVLEIRGGALLKDIIQRLESIGHESSDQNILLYSGHDTTLLSLLNALGVTDQITWRPLYGSSVNIEFYENFEIRNDFEVRLIFYRDYGDTNPIEVNIPGCRPPCAFRKFVRAVSSKLTNNYEAVCAV